MNEAAEAECAKLVAQDLHRGMNQEVVNHLPKSWGEQNVIHSFREGNARSQFVFFTQLTEHAGYHLDAACFAPGADVHEECVKDIFHSQANLRVMTLNSSGEFFPC